MSERNESIPNETFDAHLGNSQELLVKCTSCKKEFQKGKYKTCEKCRARSAVNNKKKSEQLATMAMCGYNECKNHAKANGFCNLHQSQYDIDWLLSEGKVLCSRYNRCHNYKGCANWKDENDTNKTCPPCLKTMRESDKKLRDSRKTVHTDVQTNLYAKIRKIIEKKSIADGYNKASLMKEEAIQQALELAMDDVVAENDSEFVLEEELESNSTNNSSTFNLRTFLKEQIKTQLATEYEYNVDAIKNSDIASCLSETCLCVNCGKTFELAHFLNKFGNICGKCDACRLNERVCDTIRNLNGREQKRKEYRIAYEQSESRKTLKESWKSANAERLKLYNATMHASARLQLGNDVYLERGRQQQQQYRDTHPEEMAEYNRLRREDINKKIARYKQCCAHSGKKWNLTDEHAAQLMTTSCFYCGEFSYTGSNGIDRVDSDIHYEPTNVVPCCELCNMMKKTHSVETYYNLIENILYYIFGTRYGHAYKPIETANNCANRMMYTVYKKHSIENRGIAFSLSETEFKTIISKPCYLCGKNNSMLHQNGIDRIDSGVGYEKTNCLPCCSTCNYLKHKYNLNEVVRKWTLTVSLSKNIPIPDFVEELKRHIQRKKATIL